MATIENPTIMAYADVAHINNIEFPALPLRADDVTVDQYCTENSMILGSYTQDDARHSNDGGRLYNFYDTTTSEWKNAFGYAPVVLEITYS